MLRGLHHNSRADEQKYCALCEESMESLVVLVHTVGINFRCGGKLDLTSEGGHLGFSKWPPSNYFSQNISVKLV